MMQASETHRKKMVIKAYSLFGRKSMHKHHAAFFYSRLTVLLENKTKNSMVPFLNSLKDVRTRDF